VHRSTFGWLMSALGQKQTSHQIRVMSASPPKADIVHGGRNVRFVPIADMRRFIRSSRGGQNRQADAEN